jgi:hypothetical protein
LISIFEIYFQNNEAGVKAYEGTILENILVAAKKEK